MKIDQTVAQILQFVSFFLSTWPSSAVLDLLDAYSDNSWRALGGLYRCQKFVRNRRFTSSNCASCTICVVCLKMRSHSPKIEGFVVKITLCAVTQNKSYCVWRAQSVHCWGLGIPINRKSFEKSKHVTCHVFAETTHVVAEPHEFASVVAPATQLYDVLCYVEICSEVLERQEVEICPFPVFWLFATA